MSYENTEFYYDKSFKNLGEIGEGGNGTCYLLEKDDKFYTLKVSYQGNDEKTYIEAEKLRDIKVPLNILFFASSAPGVEGKKNEILHPKNIPANKIGKFLTWILMDYVPGISLHQLIFSQRDGYKLSRMTILKIVTCIALQLDECHTNDYIHRDIKPSNIIIDHEFIPHIIDWGESTQLDNSLSRESFTFHGTPEFTAPEGFQNITTPKSDVFSFGATLFMFISKHCPFDKLSYSIQYAETLHRLILIEPYNRCFAILEPSFNNLEKALDENDEFDTIREYIIQILQNMVPLGLIDRRYEPGSDKYNQLHEFDQKMMNIAYECFSLDPNDRPSFSNILDRLLEIAEKDFPEQYSDFDKFLFQEVAKKKRLQIWYQRKS